ncbi:MAG: cytochrome c biogenesis protein CcsA, partial [Phycisphaeraceae bacterium]
MPNDWLTTLGLICAATSSVVGFIAAIRRVKRGSSQRTERSAILLAGFITLGLFVYRALFINQSWEPIESHVDGLLMLTGLLAVMIVYLQWKRPFRGLDVFALPVLVFLTLWGVCASWWSFTLFDIGGIWSGLHLWSVYLGMISATLTAATGVMYLFIQRQLRRRDHAARRMTMLGRLASLESTEGLMLRAAQVTFVFLSIALTTGFIGKVGLLPHNLASVKVWGAIAGWAIYGLVVHVRWNPAFRGTRAAILSICGFVVLLGVMGLSVALAKLASGGNP